MLSDPVWNRFKSFWYLLNNKHITVEALATCRDPCRTKVFIPAVVNVGSQCWLIASPFWEITSPKVCILPGDTWHTVICWGGVQRLWPLISLWRHLWRAIPILKHPMRLNEVSCNWITVRLLSLSSTHGCSSWVNSSVSFFYANLQFPTQSPFPGEPNLRNIFLHWIIFYSSWTLASYRSGFGACLNPGFITY